MDVVPRGVKLKTGEAVVFSYIVYKSRAHRDRVNAKAMKDSRLADMMTPRPCRSMASVCSGGFKAPVDT